MIPAVNFHLWEPCNMRCHFCFATFQDVKNSILPKGHLPEQQAIDVVQKLAQYGFKKITFAGGEPTLCKWLPALILVAKQAELTTMIVTNGTNLTDKFLKANQDQPDWITLSVDSLLDEVNVATGRAISGKKPLNQSKYYGLVDKIKSYGYGLKINTVITSRNIDANMADFIEYAQPKRWKKFQVLPIIGQNDKEIHSLVVADNEFQLFIKNHNSIMKSIEVIPETNSQMKGSYAMVDPAGRFFDNSSGQHIYSAKILEVGCQTAIEEMNYDLEKFIERKGHYNWIRNSKNFSSKFQ